MLVKYSIQHRAGVKHGNADALSRRPDPEEAGGSSKVTGLRHSEEDDDNGGSWSGEEPAFAAPEYGDTEHGGRAGEAPKDPVVREVTPNVTSECGEQWADPGHGWCRVVGTGEAGPGVEPRLVEQLSQPEEESGGSQGTAERTPEGSTSTGLDIQDAQLKDENIAPILMAKLTGGDKPELGEILGGSEDLKKLWSEWDRLEVIDGVLYRRREPSGRRSNPQPVSYTHLTLPTNREV